MEQTTPVKIKRKTGPKGPRTWTARTIEALIPDMLAFAGKPSSLFLGEWLAKKGMHREMLREFISKNPKFADAHKLAQTMLEGHLIHKGYTANPAMSIFLLKSIHKHSDRQEIELSGEITEKVTVSFVDLKSKINPEVQDEAT